ncbi:MAG: NAD(+)/NADH kinase [Planctomycetota bacterium]
MAARKRRILVLGDGRKPRVAAAANAAIPRIRERAEVVAVDLTERMDLSRTKADLAVVFGGDGSVLAAYRRLADPGTPIAGVNPGKRGFLSMWTLDGFLHHLPSVVSGKTPPSERLALSVEVVRDGEAVESFRAANDAVVTRGTISRVVHLRVSAGGAGIAAFAGDGLIVSTPAGSTAHSLSAGGPVLHPELDAIAVTPICPVTLGLRPIVVPGAEAVEVEIVRNPEETVLTLDGQVFVYLKQGDRLRIGRSRTPLRLVAPPGESYYRRAAEKLGWVASGPIPDDTRTLR